jgi:hypothetical protein
MMRGRKLGFVLLKNTSDAGSWRQAQTGLESHLVSLLENDCLLIVRKKAGYEIMFPGASGSGEMSIITVLGEVGI